MADVLNNIEAKLKELISSMSIVDGYNYDWGTVNQLDEANIIYPNCNIMQDVEDNVDDDGAATQTYDNIQYYDLVCKSPLSSIDSEPTIAINAENNKMLSDIKRLLGNNTNLDCTCEDVSYVSRTPTTHLTGDIYRAGDIAIKIKVKYSQDRKNPNDMAG